MVHWLEGAAEAEAIAAEWSRQSGPGGAIVLFGRDGQKQQASGGLAVLEHGIPFTADTVNRLASISKHILAAQLLHAGIALDAPLSASLDGLPEPLAAVELGRALDMTAALPDMMESLWQQGVPFTAGLSEAEIRARAWRLPGLNGSPGTEMAYSNTGWRLGQLVLCRHLGISYAEAVDSFMARLGIAMRFVQDETECVPGLATGYWRDGGQWRRGRYGMHFSASGGIAASANALAGWAAALLLGSGPLAGLLDRLSAPRFFRDGSPSVYRLGLVESRLGAATVLGHGGSLPGYRNHLLIVPAAGIGVVVLTNREEDALWPAMRVLAALLGEALPAIPTDGPSGLFAAADGPAWAELAPGEISFMGGYERLVGDGAGGLRSLPAYLDVRLDVGDGDALEGMIGGVRRRLQRVPATTSLDPRLCGRWRERAAGSELVIRSDGFAEMPWAAPGRVETRLTPLPGARALADLVHGPWRHRPCLWLQPDGTLRLASHRARILHYDRVTEGERR